MYDLKGGVAIITDVAGNLERTIARLGMCALGADQPCTPRHTIEPCHHGRGVVAEYIAP